MQPSLYLQIDPLPQIRQAGGKRGETTGNEQNPYYYQKDPRHFLQGTHPAVHRLYAGQEPVESHRGAEERQRQALAIGREQRGALQHRGFVRGVEEDGSEDRANAWRPPRGEHDADRE